MDASCEVWNAKYDIRPVTNAGCLLVFPNVKTNICSLCRVTVEVFLAEDFYSAAYVEIYRASVAARRKLGAQA